MPRRRIEIACSSENCQKPAKSLGLCRYHYNKKRIEDKPERAKAGLRGHPFYHLWFERKQNGVLCGEWLNFKKFIEGVGLKPDGEFYLVRLNDGPFSPTNFKWEEHLRRHVGEPNKDWWARKLAKRIAVNPSLESDRNLRRQYGMTREQYNTKLEAQNFVCAICRKNELAVDGKSNTTKKLAVDHCHETGKIRDLLCWRCNTVIGKVKEDIDLLQNMIVYLLKHS